MQLTGQHHAGRHGSYLLTALPLKSRHGAHMRAHVRKNNSAQKSSCTQLPYALAQLLGTGACNHNRHTHSMHMRACVPAIICSVGHQTVFSIPNIGDSYQISFMAAVIGHEHCLPVCQHFQIPHHLPFSPLFPLLSPGLFNSKPLWLWHYCLGLYQHVLAAAYITPSHPAAVPGVVLPWHLQLYLRYIVVGSLLSGWATCLLMDGIILHCCVFPMWRAVLCANR